jgi:hypothetical protein
MAPDRKTISRLSSICARLSSDFENERAVAALLATRILSEAGLDWRTLIERAFTPQPVPTSRPARRFNCPTDEEVALDVYRELLAQSWLNSWERQFLSDLLAKEAVSLSDKQQTCLRKILRKYAAKGGCSYAA